MFNQSATLYLQIRILEKFVCNLILNDHICVECTRFHENKTVKSYVTCATQNSTLLDRVSYSFGLLSCSQKILDIRRNVFYLKSVSKACYISFSFAVTDDCGNQSGNYVNDYTSEYKDLSPSCIFIHILLSNTTHIKQACALFEILSANE